MTRLVSLTLLTLMATTAVRAAEPPSPRSAGVPAPVATMSPIVVPGAGTPTLVASFPKTGTTVSAGLVVVSLQFDEEMSESASALAPAAAEAGEDFAPPCLSRPRRLADAKTYIFLCGAVPGKTYVLNLRAATSGLVSASGRAIAPAVIRFSTSATIIDNLADALEEAGLTADDDPIMTSQQVNSPSDQASRAVPNAASTPTGPVRRPLDSPSSHS